MALTKITGQVINTATDVTVGVLTVTNTLAVGGTVSIGGTLTYEDVTNVDSVGLITARNGIVVGSGITLSKDGDIFATGVTTSTTFSGNFSGGEFAGTTGSFSGTVDIADKIVHTGDTNTALRFPAADTITAETGGSERLRIDSSGRVLIGSTAKAGDSALQVYTSDQLHPAIRVHSPNANGFTLFGDAYQTDESNMNIGISYSSASLVISQGCKVSTSSDDAYVSSQDSYSTKPNVFRLDTDGSFSFLNTNTSSTTTTDSAVSLTERLRISSAGYFGVGTASPTRALTIAKQDDDLSGTGNNFGIYIYPKSNGYCYLDALTGSSNNTSWAIRTYNNGTYNNMIQSISGNETTFSTGGSERLRITSTGKINIGDTQMSSNLLNIEDGTAAAIDLASHGSGGDTAYIGVKKSAGGGLTFGISNRDIIFKTGATYSSGTTFDSGTERVRIDSNGRLLVGASSALEISGHTPRFQMQGTDHNTQTLSIVSNSGDANPAYLFLSKQRSGAVGGSTIVQSGDRIGEIRFNGHDGNDFAHETAIIASEVDNTPGTNDMPGRLLFYTTSDGAGSVTERMRIISAGQTKMTNNGTYQSSSAPFHEMRNSSTNQHITWFTHTGVGAVQYGIRIQTADEQNDTTHNYIDCREGGSATRRFIVYANGNVQNQNNSYGALSDEKLKENITDANSQWDDIKTLKVRNFNFINDSNKVKYLGLVAQEAETVCPSLVFTSPDTEDDSETGEIKETGTETKSLKYSVLYMKAIKCLQEAQTRIETLESRLDAAGL